MQKTYNLGSCSQQIWRASIIGFVLFIARQFGGGGYFMHMDVQCFLQASPICMSCRDMNSAHLFSQDCYCFQAWRVNTPAFSFLDDTVFSGEMLWEPRLDQVVTPHHVAQSCQNRVTGFHEPAPLSQGAWLEGCCILSKATEGITHDVCRVQRSVGQRSLSGRLAVKNDRTLSCG